jgi:hypothetical protein
MHGVKINALKLSWYGDQYRFVYSTNVSGALYCYYANFILLRKNPNCVFAKQRQETCRVTANVLWFIYRKKMEEEIFSIFFPVILFNDNNY